jgi:sulfoxide reductase heme-binding subunit YedZ
VAAPFTVAGEVWLLSTTGYGALGALVLSLAVTPLSRLAAFLGRPLPGAPATAGRRVLGITAAVLAAVHGLLAMATYLQWQWSTVWQWPYLRAGAVAVGILLLLLVTSFPRWVALLRLRLWKPLHRLAYVAAFLAFQHLLLAPFAGERLVLGLAGGVLVVELFRFLPPRSPRRREAPAGPPP